MASASGSAQRAGLRRDIERLGDLAVAVELPNRVVGDREEPGDEGGAGPPVAADRTPGLQIDLLRQVLRALRTDVFPSVFAVLDWDGWLRSARLPKTRIQLTQKP